jgi:hypothetical protein
LENKLCNYKLLHKNMIEDNKVLTSNESSGWKKVENDGDNNNCDISWEGWPQ